jgi:hypothetical protein
MEHYKVSPLMSSMMKVEISVFGKKARDTTNKD